MWRSGTDEEQDIMEEEEALMWSPALMARRASESWIDSPPSIYDEASVLTSPSPLPPAGAMSRKKSLPDVQALPRATEPMSREEVSALGSLRREEIRRMAEESERLRANPLLYLVSPGVKDWFSRQKLVMLVLFINISLAIMFFKLLT
ncbi:uncharacterized protein jp isoform X2 [Hetaerina americana]|uniref:uncharacterized protein jp isoform X2 n=1 Tax=Hetaerina americana TaxID=62018 RepID=UPI003A7F59B6